MATIMLKAVRPAASRAGVGTVPEVMKAAAIDRFGGPQVLKMHTIPVPRPEPGEVLIEVHAAGVGVWDRSVRDGTWRPHGRARFPLTMGTDGAGIVAAKGPRVRRFEVGDRVWATDYANTRNGFYAEYIAVSVEHAGIMPRRFDFREAAASLVTGLTALQGIDDALKVKEGETVLIFGATGAVGTLAIQFARRKRARVIATATGDEAAGLAKKLGANGVFDARVDDADELLKGMAPRGIDAALVLAGGETLEACLDQVRTEGRIAFPNGVWPEPEKRRTVRMLSYDAEAGRQEIERLEKAVVEARLKVPVAAEFPLAEAAAAHERLEAGHVRGRIVLKVR